MKGDREGLFYSILFYLFWVILGHVDLPLEISWSGG